MSLITLPHLFKPRSYQLPFLSAWDKGIQFLMLVAHRRMGKDKLVFANLPKKMMERVGTYFYFLPTYNQARKVIWNGADKDGFRFLDHIPKEIIDNVNETEMRITLTNGSILQLVGADSIDRIVGTNPIGVVFSEYALMKPDVWNLIYPILAENGGWAVFIFTPRGQNHAYKLLKAAENNPKWYSEVLPISKTRALPDDVILEAKMMMSEALFKQEYECDFTENATAVFKNLEACLYPISEYKENPSGIFQIGIDLAKKNDFTVLMPFDLTTFTVAPFERFNQMDYTLQKAKIENMHLRYRNPRLIVDSTGVGQPVVDDLMNAGMNVSPFMFTFNSRNEILINLQLLIEQAKIKIPDDHNLRRELEAAVWDLTANGRSRVTVPDEEDQHDDCFVKGTKILTDRGQINIEDVFVGDLVMTRNGFQPVVMTKSSMKNTAKNMGLQGTPNHPVIFGDTTKQLAHIDGHDTLYIWNESKKMIQKSSYIEGKDIIDTQNQKEDISDFIFGDMINGKNHPLRYIGKFGLIISDKYKKGLSYIIKMVTLLIMKLETWKQCLRKITLDYIQTQNTKIIGETFLQNLKKQTVYFVGLSLLTVAKLVLNIAEIVVGISTGRRKRVYNLQVANKHEYFANNILVHNCMMALALAVSDIPVRPISTRTMHTPQQTGGVKPLYPEWGI